MKPTIFFQDQGVATISGELTVRYHVDMMTLLQGIELKSITKIIIELPESLDVIGLQLFIAFKKYCIDTGHAIDIQFNLNESDRALLTKTGFESIINEPLNQTKP